MRKYLSQINHDHVIVDFGKKQLMCYFCNMEIDSLNINLRLPKNENSVLTILDSGKKHNVIMDFEQSQIIISLAKEPNK